MQYREVVAANDVEVRIQRIFRERLNVEVPSPDTELLSTGRLDSLAFVDLVFHLEAEFGITVALDELDLPQVQTISAIARYVVHRQAGGKAATE